MDAAFRETVPLGKDEVIYCLKTLEWSQGDLARRIGKSPGYLSRVLHGLVISQPVWQRIREELDKGFAELREKSLETGPIISEDSLT